MRTQERSRIRKQVDVARGKAGTSRRLIRLRDETWLRLAEVAKRESAKRNEEVSLGDVIQEALEGALHIR